MSLRMGPGGMHTSARAQALLSLMQLSDSAFPSGMYTTSSGLEALFNRGRVGGSRELHRLALAYLRMQVGTADCVALGNAYRAAMRSDLRRLVDADRTLFSTKLTMAVREASVRTGKQLLASGEAFAKGGVLHSYGLAVRSGKSPGTAPVVLAVVCGALKIGMGEAAFVLLYSSLVAMVGAGLRLGVIDHIEGQRILHSMKGPIVELSKNASRGLDSMRQFAPVLEIAQMWHERSETRMFVS